MILFSESDTISMQWARSSMPPEIQPVSGQRTGRSAVPERTQYSNRISCMPSASGDWRRTVSGIRSAITCSMMFSDWANPIPRRATASLSTVRAGRNSLSTITGMPLRDSMMISGRTDELASIRVRSGCTRYRGILRPSAAASRELKSVSVIRPAGDLGIVTSDHRVGWVEPRGLEARWSVPSVPRTRRWRGGPRRQEERPRDPRVHQAPHSADHPNRR